MTNYTFEYLDRYETVYTLKQILRSMGAKPGDKNRLELINEILDIQNGKEPVNSKRGRPSKSSGISMKDYFNNVSVRDNVTQFKYEKTIKGILDIVEGKYGFIRPLDNVSTAQAFIAKTTILQNNLSMGDVVEGELELIREKELPEVTKVIKVNGCEPKNRSATRWEDLPAIYPNHKINLTCEGSTLRAIDVFAPIGLGQRVVIQTKGHIEEKLLVKKILNCITSVKKDITTAFLTVGERPEELSAMAESLGVEIYGITFDKSYDYQRKMCELAIARCKRVAEEGKDALLIIDSLKKIIRKQDYTKSDTVDVQGLYFLKRVLSMAKNTEKSSFTVILITGESDSAEFQGIVSEFKDTANCLICESDDPMDLSHNLFVDIRNSYTKRADLLTADYVNVELLRQLIKTGKTQTYTVADMLKNSDVGDVVSTLCDQPIIP